MSGMRIYLMRHGETSWNADGNRYAGRTDIPLSETGRSQARAAGVALERVEFSRVYCSALQRSRETAELVAGDRSVQILPDARINEIDFGGWEGKTAEVIQRDDPASWTAWGDDPTDARAGGTGETGREVCQRMTEFMTALSDDGGNNLIVGHNTLNRLFIAHTLGMPLRNYKLIVQNNAGLNVLERNDGHVRWLRINQTLIGEL